MDKRVPVLVPLALLVFLLGGCGSSGGGAPASRSRAELTNPFLGPDYSAWLIGPVARIATPEEIRQFLALKDDPQAEAFVQGFWDRRDPSPAKPGNPVRDAFDSRAAEADRKYSEAGLLGRRTDRGTLYVVYGPPSKTDYEVSPIPNGPPLEVWTYNADAPSGLDARRPAGVYRFIKQGDLTVLYLGGRPSPTLIQPSPEPPL
ncbi:MAG TPA: GWxTD domain-containing protein [Thermoanaerobaculia bacterium]|jgi:GWxTD domain-containing protein|nr:GWxTD domain-containing protein [Thermoanaerobaculia bacterium]